MRPLRVALLTYSVKPRGGVVHTLAVAEALVARGHRVEVFALARPGERFVRAPGVPVTLVPNHAEEEDFDRRVAAMIDAYRTGLREPLGAGFDVVHAQDCLSANSAIGLRDEGVLEAVIRTVHHVDDFTSPSLMDCQRRSILGPDHLLCVSEPWERRLRAEFGVRARSVGNGVDRTLFPPARDGAERERDRAAAGLDGRLAILAVGGVEPRKGSLTLVEGFARLRRDQPELDPLLLVAGGATLFDYRPYRERFAERVEQLGLDLERDVRLTGTLDQETIGLLFRAADLFAFPSLKEGFGLALLEAASAGLPIVASDLDVVRSFLRDGESALLTPVGDAPALAAALGRLAGDPDLRGSLRAGADRVARAHDWASVAERHEQAYRTILAGRAAAA